METQIENNYKSSIKEMLLRLHQWFRMLLKKWVFLSIIGITGAIIGLLLSIIAQPKYESKITFVLEDSKSGGALGAYAGLASQFGIDIGGGSGGVFQGDNILLLLKSKLLVRKALLSSYTSDNKHSLADQYLIMSGLKSKWSSNQRLFPVNIPVSVKGAKTVYSILQDSIVDLIYDKILENNLSVQKIDKKLSFVSVNCISKDELFSKYFVERLVAEATDLYILTKTKRSKTNVEKLTARADSLENLMNAKTYFVANAQDLNLNPVRKLGTVNTELAARDRIILQTIYGEVVKNLEVAKMTLSQETPIIQIIDTPNLPLHKIAYRPFKSIFLGFFICLFTGILFFTVNNVYKNIMQ